MFQKCKSIGCEFASESSSDFCQHCEDQRNSKATADAEASMTLSQRYPKYYKPLGDLTEIDVYAVHHLFNIQDPSGAIQHSSKKLLLSGVRTGGKSKFKDIKEARDTLTRWMQLNPESKDENQDQRPER